ncbi:hypothetical protein CgunFtcFv8_018551 [Champsocephalus gunnari]|uniref:Uncharacterized protein n=1 Tax=Champsocephalus gunnari TaxID=52237 RepID=A0AAN8BTN0_CHAGU|nr:hypothetical protein CgunFtcFv8_018551 [Champsocephalus gunnari]
MARRAVIFLCAFGLFQKGLSALIYELHEPFLHVVDSVVSCSATGRPAPTKEVSMAIPEVKMLAIKGSEEDSRPDNSGVALALIIVSVVLFCVCVAVAITAFLCIRKHLKSVSEKDSERTKTPQKSTKDSLEAQTTLMMEENELRQHTPPGGKNNNNSETSHLKVKNNLFS